MMWYWHDGLSWWGWLGMSFSMIIFWGLVIWGIVALVRYLNAPGPRFTSSGQHSTTSEAILAERFARGEIDEREYTRTREILQSTDQGAGNASSENTSREREPETVAR